MPKLLDKILSLLGQGNKPPQNPPPPPEDENDDDGREHVRERLPIAESEEQKQAREVEERQREEELEAKKEKSEEEERETRERMLQHLRQLQEDNSIEPTRPLHRRAPTKSFAEGPFLVRDATTQESMLLVDYAKNRLQQMPEHSRNHALNEMYSNAALNDIFKDLSKSRNTIDSRNMDQLTRRHIQNIVERGNDYLKDLIQHHLMQQARRQEREQGWELER